MNHKYVVLATILLIMLFLASILIGIIVLSKQTSTKPLTKPFYVGVEFAYADQFGELKTLVDKVKDYTNLFVIGSVGLSFNRTALNEACDYIFNAKLNFIVLFTGLEMYNYNITEWMQDANLKYGCRFLGIYRYDEPGGNQLDHTQFMLINNTTTYAETAESYVGNLSSITKYYFDHGSVSNIFTSDYGLYWFDYNASYSTIFAEFVGNQSRQRIIALDRGAAESFSKSWGVIIDWKYDQPPSYLESGNELYSDLSQAYNAGATYAVVFSYPNVTNFGTLTQAHFDASKKFWNNIHNNLGSFASYNAEVAYVIPKDYGFGFRSSYDNIWGLFQASNDSLLPKIWNDTQFLLSKYDTNFNIIYDDPVVIGSTLSNYTKIFYWNQTIT